MDGFVRSVEKLTTTRNVSDVDSPNKFERKEMKLYSVTYNGFTYHCLTMKEMKAMFQRIKAVQPS